MDMVFFNAQAHADVFQPAGRCAGLTAGHGSRGIVENKNDSLGLVISRVNQSGHP